MRAAGAESAAAAGSAGDVTAEPATLDKGGATDGREIIAEFVDVHRHYVMGDNIVRALDGVSIQIGKGEYVSIMGRSGSGKSTLLNLMGCLDRPTGGAYVLGGRDVSRLSDDALSEVRGTEIGFIFQSFNLIPQLTVSWRTSRCRCSTRTPSAPKPRSRKAEELAIRVGLEGRLDHRPQRALRRPAAARRHRPGADERPPLPARRRGDGQPRQQHRTAEILALLDELHAEGMTIGHGHPQPGESRSAPGATRRAPRRRQGRSKIVENH